MNSYQSMLSRLTSLILARELPYKDTIIIGDNSSGKSDIVRKLIEDGTSEDYYLIDAVNRSFDIAQIGVRQKDIVYSSDINRNRLESCNFNIRDTFYYKGTPMAVEDFYPEYADELKRMMSEFLDISFDIVQSKVGWVACIDGVEVTLSNGYQALLRIFLETKYYDTTVGHGTVVIDEVDEYLFAKNSGRIYDYLRSCFPMLDFIVTTHSPDLIANTEKANIILLHENVFEVLDAGDFESISQVYNIFVKVFQNINHQTEKQYIDNQLRILWNNRMAGIWGSDEQNAIDKIVAGDLTKSQKLLVRQIREW